MYDYFVNVYPTTLETYVAPSTPSLTRTSTGKRVPLPSTLEDPVDPEHLWIMNTYFHYEMYLYRRCERLLPRRPVNAYFLYTAPNSFRPETHASKV